MKMNEMKKRCLAVLLCGMVSFLTACGTAQENTKEDIKEDAVSSDVEQQNAVEILRFVDAHGNWYETVVREDVRKHSYDWGCLLEDNGMLVYEDEEYISRSGIDVSKYQGDIIWEDVAEAGIEFVYIRIGYRGYGETGTICLDDQFYDNLSGAKAAGLDVGAYFFSQAINETEAMEEAEFVLEALEDVLLELPVVYDPERILTDDARTDTVSGEQFTKNTVAFCEAVKQAGYDAMVYSNMLWEANEFDMSVIEQYPVWYADYEALPQTPYDFVIWQYSEKGQVAGIEGPVDLNIEFLLRK